MTDPDDGSLFDRYLRDRDRRALAELFERYARRLYGLALAVLRDGPAAEDAVQQVFLRLLEARRGPEPGHFRVWLYRIATNETMQMLRTGRRRQQREQKVMRERNSSEDAASALRHELDDGISGLEAPLQEVIRLRYQHGLAFHEVARVLDRPQGTVARQAHEAREQLRRRLAVTGLLAGLSLESVLEAMELPALPDRLIQRIMARTSPSIFVRLPFAAALLVPVVAGLIFMSALRSREPDAPAESARLPEPRLGPASLPTLAVPDSPKERDPLLTTGDGREGRLRVLEVRFRITLSPPGSEDTRVSIREVLDLETTARGSAQQSAIPETSGSSGTYVASLRCTSRTMYEVVAFTSGKGEERPIWPRRFIAASPGDAMELRLAAGEPSEGSYLEPVLRELPHQKKFGAIRGRFIGADTRWRAVIAGLDSSWKEETWEIRNPGDEFVIIPAPPGARELRLSDFCCSTTIPVTVKPGEVVDLGTILHEKRGTGIVRGRLIDPQSRPVPEAEVTLQEGTGAGDGRGRTVKTDADGRFAFTGVDEAFRNPVLYIVSRSRSSKVDRHPVRIGDVDLVVSLPDRPKEEAHR